MLLNRLQIKNFCQHRDFETHFDPGLNLIIGPNGSGKSNLLEAIQFAILGELTKHTREQAVCHYAGEKDECLVSLDFQHFDFNVGITRSIRPSLHNLTCSMRSDTYNTALEGYAEVNSYVLELLDMQKKQLQDYVFIAQGGLDNLIEKTKEQRTIELAKIFGVAETEKIWEVLGTQLTKIEVPTIPDLATTEQKITQLKIECSDIDNQVDNLTKQLLTKEQYTEIWDIINDQKLRHKLLKSWNTARIREDELAEHVVNFTDITVYEDELDQLYEKVANAEKLATEADELLMQWREYNNFRKVVDSLKADFDKIKAAFRQRYGLTDGYTKTLDAARQSFDDIKSDLADVTTAIRTAEASIRSAVCSTCKRPFDNYEEIEKELAERREDHKIISAIYEQLHQVLTIDDNRAKIKQQIQVYKDNVNRVQAVAQPTVSEAVCRQRKLSVVMQRKDVTKLVDKINKLKLEKAVIESDYSNAQKQVTDYETQLLDGTPVNRKEFNMLLSYLVTNDTQKEELQKLLEQQTRKHVELEHAEQSFEEGLKLVDRRKKVIAGRDYLVSLRDLFHRGNLAKRIIETYLATICVDVNEMLNMFEAPFRVVCGEHLNFDAVFTGNKRVPDKLLSGGQRVTLSLAFRTALNARFAASMGLLSLDEPTVFMDKQTKQCLPEVLEKLRILCREKQLQLLFVTHEMEFMDHFDKVIQLERL